MKTPAMIQYDVITVKQLSDRKKKGDKLNFHERNILRIAEKRDKKKKCRNSK